MVEGKFKLRFMDQPDRFEPSIEYYRPYFESYCPQIWRSEMNGGFFHFYSAEGKNYQCTINHFADHGLIVELHIYLDKKYIDGWITVSDFNRLHEIVDIGSDEFRYIGNFVPPLQAWKIVKAYLTNPIELPTSPLLLNFSDLPETSQNQHKS